MGSRRRMHERLVVEELVALRRHVGAVEPEHAPQLRRLVDFQELERRLPAVEQRPGEIDAARFVQLLEDLFRHENWAPARWPQTRPAGVTVTPRASWRAGRVLAGRAR